MKKILIALSSEFTSEIFKEEFLRENFQVATINDGNRALEIIKKVAPDIILADANLPGLTAFELLDKISEFERSKRVPLVVYSRTGSEKQREEAMDHEAKDFVVGLSDSPKAIVLKIKSHLGEEKSYLFDLSRNLEEGRKISQVLGYPPEMRCPKCGTIFCLHF